MPRQPVRPPDPPTPRLRDDRWGWSLLAAGALARFSLLGADPVWLDEALSAGTARLPAAEILAGLRGDLHPPGYYLLLHAWTAPWPANAAGFASEGALRSLSALASLLTLPLLYHLGFRLAPDRRDPRVSARWAMGLAALSPFAIALAREARPYALLGLLLALQWLLLLRLRREPGRPARWIALALALAAGFYVHYHAFVFLLALTGAMAVSRSGPPGFAARWLACAAAGVAAFLPWLPVLRAQVLAGVRDWIGFDHSPLILLRTVGAFFRGDMASSDELFLWSLPVAVLAAGGVPRGGARAAWLAAGVLGLTYAASLFANVYEPRYLIGAALPVWVLAARGMTVLPARGRGWRAAAVLTLAAMAAGLALGGFRGRGRVEDWRSLVARVERQASAGDVVLFAFPEPITPYVYYHTDGSLRAVGGLQRAAGGFALRAGLDRELAGAGTVWLITYLEPVYDPEGRLRGHLALAGLRPGRPIGGSPKLQAVPFRAPPASRSPTDGRAREPS